MEGDEEGKLILYFPIFYFTFLLSKFAEVSKSNALLGTAICCATTQIKNKMIITKLSLNRGEPLHSRYCHHWSTLQWKKYTCKQSSGIALKEQN